MEHETEYVQIMIDSLKKKVDILNQITSLNQEQKVLIQAEVLDLEAFDVTVDKKSECIDILTNLDSGFQKLYDRVKEALEGKKDTYKSQIKEMQDLAEFFKVFGDATRLKILYVLKCSEMCVYDIANMVGMSQSAISHQLRILKQMDLVKNRREGKTIFYSLADSHIVTILSQGLDHIEE